MERYDLSAQIPTSAGVYLASCELNGRLSTAEARGVRGSLLCIVEARERADAPTAQHTVFSGVGSASGGAGRRGYSATRYQLEYLCYQLVSTP